LPFGSASDAPLTLSRVIGGIADKIALLRVWRDGEEYRGTGYAVSGDGLIATCLHQVADADRIEARFVGRGFSEAQLVESDASADMALLRVRRHHPPKGLELDGADAGVGVEVAFVGFPFSTLFDPPLVMTMRGIIGNRYGGQYVIDAMMSEGMSGSPLFLTSNGRVVGTMSARLDPVLTEARLLGVDEGELRKLGRERTTISFAIPSPALRALVSAYRK